MGERTKKANVLTLVFLGTGLDYCNPSTMLKSGIQGGNHKHVKASVREEYKEVTMKDSVREEYREVTMKDFVWEEYREGSIKASVRGEYREVTMKTFVRQEGLRGRLLTTI